MALFGFGKDKKEGGSGQDSELVLAYLEDVEAGSHETGSHRVAGLVERDLAIEPVALVPKGIQHCQA